MLPRPRYLQSIFPFALLLLLFASSVAQADSELMLRKIPPQTIVPGQTFNYRLIPSTIAAEHVRVRLLNKPKGVDLQLDTDGTPVFVWTPPVTVRNETVVIVQSYDVRQPHHVNTQRMVLNRGLVASSLAAQVNTDVDSDDAVLNNAATNSATTDSATTSNTATNNTELALQTTQALPTINQHAPQLISPATQTLMVGTEYQLIVRPTDADGDAVGFVAKRLPVGATLDAVFDGVWSLNWRPEVAQAGLHEIELVATEKTQAANRTVRRLILDVKDPDSQTQIVLASANTSQVGTASQNVLAGPESSTLTTTGTRTAGSVSFKPLSSQIVSAGRTINFPVASVSEDDIDAILHIDRLPGLASFDINDDGSRTFHWPTTPADQGEHIFRFTAVHPNDARQVAIREVLIVIGDPAAPGSYPDRITPLPGLDD